MDNKPGIVVEKEAEIVLPPPTSLNPIPSLPVALRVDNREQVLSLLQTDPNASTVLAIPDSAFRQLIVFGSANLRILIMRQVLSDPHSRKLEGKKKNMDPYLSFPLPKSLNIVGTMLLGGSSDALLGENSNINKLAIGPLQHQLDEVESWDDDVEGVDVITYFLRSSDLSQTEKAAKRIFRQGNKRFRTHHRLVYLPQPTAMVLKLVKNLGLAAAPNVSLYRLQLDVFPLETDLLSLEYDNALKEAIVEGTPSPLITTVARSILKLQDIVGKIPRIQSYGPLGEEVVRKFLNLTVDEYLATKDRPEEESGPVAGGGVAVLFIVDRRVDMFTPMISPLTYEGLLDDVVGIDCGFINVRVDTIDPEDESVRAPKDGKPPAEKKRTTAENGEIVALAVNGSDSIFSEIRSQHLQTFGSFLNKQSVALHESRVEFDKHGKDKDVFELSKFVKTIPALRQHARTLTNHVHLGELVSLVCKSSTFRERWQLERDMLEGGTFYDELDELVATQYPPYRFFRLLCLQSLCSGGIKYNRYDSLRRDIVQTYGYEYLFVLDNLEKAGLLRRRDGLFNMDTSMLNKLREPLGLIHAEVDTGDPDDIAYVSSGYAPLSARLVQRAVNGWSGQAEILRELPGRLVDVTQQNPPEDLAAALKRPAVGSLGALAAAATDGGSKKAVMMVFYIGGVTYSELAALRFLSKRPQFPYHIVCVTTKVINGQTLLQSLT
jgi:vacuolar protein sorting-associated protein 33A